MTGDALRRVGCAGLVGAAATAVVAVAQVAALQGQPGDDFTAYLPPGDGKALVTQQCTSCHDLQGVVRLRAVAAEWETLVLDMGARGAPIMLDDVDPLVKYLSTAFGPNAPPFTDANAATNADLTRLPGVTPQAAGRLIAARSAGPLTSVEQVRTALGLDASAFEKIKYYLYVKPVEPAGNQ
ncbi:MAG: hypothetical protein GEU99_23740 [Luteitalea sp.]|nr:hypothetical protein [Luteitalea sp.]